MTAMRFNFDKQMSTIIAAVFLFLRVLFSIAGGDPIGGRHGRDLHDELTFNANDHHVFKENMPSLSVRSDILRSDRVHRASIHEVVFVIRQRNMEELTGILHDVSNPESPNYGHHLTQEKVKSMTINPESRDAVLSYLSSVGSKVKSVTRGGDFIIAEAPVSVWEEMFRAEFFTLQQTLPNGRIHEVVRADAYSIPSDLHAHVESVLNILEIPNGERASFLNTFSPQISANLVTPSKLRKFYNMSSSHGSSQSTQAVFGAIQIFFSPADLRTFQKSQNLTYQTATDIGSHSSDDVCEESPENCGEANLDMQYIMGMSPGSPTTYWYTDFGFTSWLTDVSQASEVPLVLSISYGQEERYVTKAMLDAFNTIAIKVSAMGVTIFVASGDDGANSRSVRNGSTSLCGYQTDFPSVSPYLTAVGATSGLEFGYNSGEVVAEGNRMKYGITSGGGFSTYYPQPSWQTAAVRAYFTTAAGLGQTPKAGYAAKGRAYPDISLAGINYLIFTGGISYLVSGTSATSPAVAGMFSNINAARLSVGKGSVGWINPTLYTKGSYFVNDITSGNTKCAADGTCCSTGFYATAGWDPATGLGSVNYGKMASLFLALGSNINPSTPSMSPTLQSPSSSSSSNSPTIPSTSPTLLSSPPSKSPLMVPSSTRALPISVPPSFSPYLSPTISPDSDPSNYDFLLRPSVLPTLSPAASSPAMDTHMPVFVSSSSSSDGIIGNQIPYGTMIGIVVGTVLAFIVVVLAAVTAIRYHRRSAAQQKEVSNPPTLASFYPVNGALSLGRDSIPELTQSQASSP